MRHKDSTPGVCRSRGRSGLAFRRWCGMDDLAATSGRASHVTDRPRLEERMARLERQPRGLRQVAAVLLLIAGAAPFLALRGSAGQRDDPPARTLSLPLAHNQNLKFVWIEPGRFQMGSPASDPLAAEAEKPQREVRIA